MKHFKYHQSTEILFGSGRISELPEVIQKYGKKALLVTIKAAVTELEDQYNRVMEILKNGGIEVAHYDGVVPNPTIESITAGAKMAKDFGADLSADGFFPFDDDIDFQTRSGSWDIGFDEFVAAGQPFIKRLGGVPYMRINKGVW